MLWLGCGLLGTVVARIMVFERAALVEYWLGCRAAIAMA